MTETIATESGVQQVLYNTNTNVLRVVGEDFSESYNRVTQVVMGRTRKEFRMNYDAHQTEELRFSAAYPFNVRIEDDIGTSGRRAKIGV